MILVIGAGVSGLTVANNLGDRDYTVLEKEDFTGGLATRYESGGYWFDYSGHYFHFQGKEEVKTYLENFCRFREFKRQSKTFLLDRYIPFPVQFHLSHLPASLKNQILLEMLEARSSSGIANMEDFILTHFGETLGNLFFRPFLTRYYHTPLDGLAANMDKGSIPVPDKAHVQAGAEGKVFQKTGYNPVIYYPAETLLGFIENYTRPVSDRIRMKEEVIEIDGNKQEVRTRGGVYKYEKLVSTMPLKTLLQILKPAGQFPSHRQLTHVSTLLVNVVMKRKRKRFHWVYLAEEKFPFYRVGMYAVTKKPSCYMERNILPGSAVPPKEEIHRDVAFTLKELGVIADANEIEYIDARIIPISYVIFDRNWPGTVPPILEELKKHNIYSIGRYGTWNYSSMANDIKDALDFVLTL